MTAPSAFLEASGASVVAAARQGDGQAFDCLYRAHVGSVTAICRRRLPSGEVEDAVQEVFVRAWRRLDSLEDPEAFGAWVRSIAVRVCVDVLRRSGRSVPMSEPPVPPDPRPSPDDLLVLREDTSRVTDGLARLGDRDRRALWLRDGLEWPIRDVAEEMGTTEGSTRVLLARARRRLRAAMVAVVAWLVTVRLALRHHARVDLVPASTGLIAAQLFVGLTLPPAAPVPDPAPIEQPPPASAPSAPIVADVVPTAASPTTAPAVEQPHREPPATAAPTVVESPVEPASDGPDAEPPIDIESRPADPDGPSPLELSAEDDQGSVVDLQFFVGELLDPDDDGDEEAVEPSDERQPAEQPSPSGLVPVCLLNCFR